MSVVNEEKLSIREADNRFDNTNDRLISLEKRIDDIKWYMGGITAFLGIIFAIISFISSENTNSEKIGLIEFKKEMREDLFKNGPPPSIQVYKDIDVSLADADVTVQKYVDSSRNNAIRFDLIVKNAGGSPAFNLLFKIYTSDPIKLGNFDVITHKLAPKYSSDEKMYKYETFVSADNAPLPANMTDRSIFNLFVLSAPPPGKYPVLLKISYGTKDVSELKFNIVVNK